MVKGLRYIGQAALYGLFVAFIGYFSNSPAYMHLPPDQALLKFTVHHPGQVEQACRQRTADELAKLAPNMRAPLECSRERSNVLVEYELDEKPVYRAELPPAGLWHDGASTLYYRLPVPAGRHTLRARLKDHQRLPEYNYTKVAEVDLRPGQVFVVDFNARRGGFFFR